MELNRYFDYEFDEGVESQADEIVHEAKDKIADLIYENVKSEIEQDRQNYVRAKERADELQKECYEQREKIEALEIELKKAKENLEKRDREIPQTPFALGDEVWYARQVYDGKKSVKCPICNGEGYIFTENYAYGKLKCICPRCQNAWGKSVAEYDAFEVNSGYIRRIAIFQSRVNGTLFDYGIVDKKESVDIPNFPYVKTFTNVYATKEEALKHAAELELEEKKKAEEKIFGEKQ